MPRVARRIHVSKITLGNHPLDETEAHHALNVLRLTDGTVVELFDDHGATAAGVLQFRERGSALVRVEGEIVKGTGGVRITIASAVPKGDRADWLAEKLSELGVTEWIPLAAERSVVLPEGTGKRDRWVRIATEAAKQSRRAGVMRIGPLTKLPALLASLGSSGVSPGAAWCLSTESSAPAFASSLAAAADPAAPLTLFVGPEGGWSPAEMAAFEAAGVAFVRLGGTVLRIETAAVAAAAVVSAAFAARA
jgi:16S rRNA (uracil1498-N3)-methyltransferase